jgi:uncharacterized protein
MMTRSARLPGKQKDFFRSPAGGGDDFIRVLLEEMKPFVEARYQVDQARQIIFGKSLGGLLVIHLLFVHPDAFQTYLIASPAIWWDDRSVLAKEIEFSQGIKTSNLRLNYGLIKRLTYWRGSGTLHITRRTT